MTTVLRMSDCRAIFVLPEGASTVVFLASRGRRPRLAHERSFPCRAAALAYADELAAIYGCCVVGATAMPGGPGHLANGQ